MKNQIGFVKSASGAFYKVYEEDGVLLAPLPNASIHHDYHGCDYMVLIKYPGKTTKKVSSRDWDNAFLAYLNKSIGTELTTLKGFLKSPDWSRWIDFIGTGYDPFADEGTVADLVEI